MRASGSAFWSLSPARPCWEGLVSPRSDLEPAALAIAWASSKTITPSKPWRSSSSSEPASHSTICSSREGFPWRDGERSVA